MNSLEVRRVALPQQITEQGIVAIARGVPTQQLVDAARTLASAGITAIEVSLSRPDALLQLSELASAMAGTNCAVGAGTVLSVGAAERAAEAGATFLVYPHTGPDITQWSQRNGIPTLAGAYTPTEVLAAWQAGASAIKLFPASIAGPGYVRALLDPFPQIPIVAVGGIDATTAHDYIAHGCTAVGVGSALFTPTRELVGVARRLLAMVERGRDSS